MLYLVVFRDIREKDWAWGPVCERDREEAMKDARHLLVRCYPGGYDVAE